MKYTEGNGSLKDLRVVLKYAETTPLSGKGEITMTKRLRMDLQHFASEDGAEGTENNEGKGGDENVTGNEDTGEGETGTDGEDTSVDEKLFTQADLDRLIKKRLDRNADKVKEEQERIRKETEKNTLKENEQYKELADEYKAEIDGLKEKFVSSTKEKSLTKAGYSEEQVAKYTKFVTGSTDEEISESVDELIQDIPPKRGYVDPSVGNSSKGNTPKKDDTEVGKTAFDRIKNKIRK